MPITDQQITEVGGLRLSTNTCLAPDTIEVRILGVFGGEVALMDYGRIGDVVAALTTPASVSEGAAAVAELRAITGAGSDAEMYRRCAVMVAALTRGQS